MWQNTFVSIVQFIYIFVLDTSHILLKLVRAEGLGTAEVSGYGVVNIQ